VLSIGNFVSENFHLAVKVKIGVTETLHQKEYSDVGTYKLANIRSRRNYVCYPKFNRKVNLRMYL